jgi:hypothetical protein
MSLYLFLGLVFVNIKLYFLANKRKAKRTRWRIRHSRNEENQFAKQNEKIGFTVNRRLNDGSKCRY